MGFRLPPETSIQQWIFAAIFARILTGGNTRDTILELRRQTAEVARPLRRRRI